MDRGGEHVIHSALLCSLLLDGDSECQDRLWNKTLYWGTSRVQTNIYPHTVYGFTTFLIYLQYQQLGMNPGWLWESVESAWMTHHTISLTMEDPEGTWVMMSLIFAYGLVILSLAWWDTSVRDYLSMYILTMHDECVSHLTCIWCMLCRVEVGMNIGPLPFIHVAKSALSYLIQRFTAALV